MVEEEANDSIWPKYNQQLREIAEANLKKQLPAGLKKTFSGHLATSFNNIGYQYAMSGKISEADVYFLKCIEVQKQNGDKKGMATTLNTMGNFYRRMGDTNALKYYQEALKINREIKDREGESTSLYFVGWIYDNKGDITRALEYYNRSLKIQEQIGNKKGMANTLNNIAYIYNNQGDKKTAIEFYTKSLKLYEEIKETVGIGAALNNLGNIYYKQNNLAKAKDYYERSYEKFKLINDKSGIGYSLNNLGSVVYKQGDISKAFDYYTKSLNIRMEILDKQGVSISSSNLGEVYLRQNNLNEAQTKCLYGLKVAQETGYAEGIRMAASLLHRIYAKQKNGMKAYEMHKLYIQMRDSIDNIATQKAVITQYAKHVYEKKAAEDSVRVAEEKKITALQFKQEKTQRYALYGGLALVLVFAGFVFNRFKITQRQKHIIEKQKEQVDEKQKEIVESITYAKRLQEAILPPRDFVSSHLPGNFILYEPKDIVAGDFYWAEASEGKFFIAAADSTGHGVPGAMVSVVCSNALNRAVKEFNLRDTGKILDKARELVLETFEKSASEVKDGMDISLLCIDSINEKIFWSGANNPLWYISDKELKELKADKQPIGKTDYPKPFTTHEIKYQKGDIFYLFTDGYADQFGGPNGKKFKYKQFSNVLLKNYNENLAVQESMLRDSFATWRGGLEQVDDVCVIGIKL